MVENDFIETSDQQWHWFYALERRHVIRIYQNIIIECENTRISEENKQGWMIIGIQTIAINSYRIAENRRVENNRWNWPKNVITSKCHKITKWHFLCDFQVQTSKV